MGLSLLERIMKLAVITGASAGIGAEIARQLLSDGWAVHNLSRRPCPVPGVTQHLCDLTEESALTETLPTLEALAERAEKLVLIHNAGLLRKDAVDDLRAEALRQVLEVNVVAPSRLNGALIPKMKAGSAVIYVGSTLGEKAVAGAASYVTSKHATIGLMRATCQDLAGRGIHTACVCPGFTDTEMLRAHVGDQGATAVAAFSAFGRLITPEEIAETVVWAATHPVVNGAVLHANLGQVER